MFFQSKIDRLLKKEKTEEYEVPVEKIELEKGDIPAMFLAALLTFLPAILFIALLFAGVAYLMFH